MKKTDLKTYARNLVCNWYFPIGATAYFCANVQWRYEGMFVPPGLWIATLLCAVFAMLIPSITDRVYRMHWTIKLLAATTAAGAFWDTAAVPLGGISFSQKVECMNGLMEPLHLPFIAGDIAIAFAWLFAFVCIAMLFNKLAEIIKKSGLLDNVTLWECAIYGILLLASTLVIFVAFDRSGIFYGQGGDIFTGDSNIIVPDGLYVSFYHPDNDIHQPLFAVCATPFVGLAYFLGAFAFKWPTAQMLLLNFSQLLLIFGTGFILAKMLELCAWKRICFLVLFCCSYMYVLFILMMEQYAVSVFWLVLCAYLISCRKPDPMVTIGAGGAMITSLAFVPFAQGIDPRKDFWGWFWGCVKHGVGFVAVIFAFCRTDAILELKDSIPALLFFTGKVSLWNRVLQFLSLIRNCFLAPQAFVEFGAMEKVHWKQVPVTEVSAVGVALLCLILLSLWLNRKKRSTLLCGYWMAFSVVILVIAGWGTMENGLLLYALYFGWAYIALLFQLVEWLGETWKKPWLLPVATVLATGAMLAFNIPEIMNMIRFAATYYPG